jgi:hypothetical protein
MMPPPTNTFDCIQFGQFTNVPPDMVWDIGPNHYVQMVNVAFAVFNKTTIAVLFPPMPIRVATLFRRQEWMLLHHWWPDCFAWSVCRSLDSYSIVKISK